MSNYDQTYTVVMLDESQQPAPVSSRCAKLRREAPEPSLRIRLGQLLARIKSNMIILSTPTQVPPACKYYGHVIGKRKWKGEFPQCDDCGITIKSHKMLRAASLR